MPYNNKHAGCYKAVIIEFYLPFSSTRIHVVTIQIISVLQTRDDRRIRQSRPPIFATVVISPLEYLQFIWYLQTFFPLIRLDVHCIY